MAITINNVITWADLTNTCLTQFKSVCCNIDAFSSSVPARLRNGTAQDVVVRSWTTTAGGGVRANTWSFKAHTSNLITVVTSTVVNNEWTAFLASAGINARSNKLIQAKDMTLAIALVMQFMSYHIKPVYSRRQIYNTIESQAVFQGQKYVSGTINPKYTLTGIDPTTAPEVTNSDITNIVNQNLTAEQLIRKYSNPVVTRYELTVS